jgi:hypothetical protein
MSYSRPEECSGVDALSALNLFVDQGFRIKVTSCVGLFSD